MHVFHWQETIRATLLGGTVKFQSGFAINFHLWLLIHSKTSTRRFEQTKPVHSKPQRHTVYYIIKVAIRAWFIASSFHEERHWIYMYSQYVKMRPNQSIIYCIYQIYYNEPADANLQVKLLMKRTPTTLVATADCSKKVCINYTMTLHETNDIYFCVIKFECEAHFHFSSIIANDVSVIRSA